MNIVAIIPAREGSRRLPHKNILPFCGRPLVAWSLMQARCCEEIQEVYLTTDSEQIADIGREYGVTVLMREHEWESLHTTGGGVPLTLAALRIEKLRSVDATVCLFPTAPLRKTGDIPKLIEVYRHFHEQIISQVPIKDAFIDRRIAPNSYRQFIRDKEENFMKEVGGTDIMPMAYHYRPQIGPSTQVKEDDPSTYSEFAHYPLNSAVLRHIELDWWQGFEIDYADEFDLCQYLFGKYLKAEWEVEYKKLEATDG